MRKRRFGWRLGGSCLLLGVALCGCQGVLKKVSDRLARWDMLGDDALEDPIKAVGGDGVLFMSAQQERPLSRQ